MCDGYGIIVVPSDRTQIFTSLRESRRFRPERNQYIEDYKKLEINLEIIGAFGFVFTTSKIRNRIFSSYWQPAGSRE